MTQKSWIVVEDPSGEWWEGSLVDETRTRQLQARGVTLLPTNPDLFKVSGVGAFHKRSWGAGWSLDTPAPKQVAPMIMYCSSAFRVIHWAARIGLDDKIPDEQPINGFLRFAADFSQAVPGKLGLQGGASIDVRALTAKRPKEGYVIGGRVETSVPQDSHYGFSLYGLAPGLRVIWSACSQGVE